MSSTRTSRVRRAQRSWTRLSDEQLLGLRFCDLKLKIERSPVAKRVKRPYSELDKRQISFRPHVWLSEEWFSPDGVPGVSADWRPSVQPETNSADPPSTATIASAVTSTVDRRPAAGPATGAGAGTGAASTRTGASSGGRASVIE